MAVRPRSLALFALSVILTGCSLAGPPPQVSLQPKSSEAQQGPAAKPAASEAKDQALPADYVGKLSVSPKNGLPGTKVTITGSGLPANTQMDVIWSTAKGSWTIKGEANEEYHGQRYEPVYKPMGKATTDAQGNLETSLIAPDDYGFYHDVSVLQNGVVRNKASFKVDMAGTISPTSGPVGTPINLEVRGLGWQKYESPWYVIYDNKFTGYLSAVTTQGIAKAQFPAVGGPGKHVIEIYPNPFTFPYLNPEQGPFGLQPINLFFTITPGEAVVPPPIKQQEMPIVQGTVPAGNGMAVWTDVTSGTVGTPVKISGRGLPVGKTVDLLWTRVVGNRVAGQGWKEDTTSLGKPTVDSQGNISVDFAMLDDLGGPHRIDALIDGKTVTSTSVTVTPSVRIIGENRGPAGTEFKLNMNGIGWTETANIYHINYDNSYIGYACGFNSQGNVTVFMKATGEPGWHFIELYPGIYKGEEPMGLSVFRVPQLTSAQDHPGEKLPAFRLAYYVTP